MSEDKNIYNIKLHEELIIDKFNSVMRVAGGWVYKNFGVSEDTPASLVFVPFHNGFYKP